VGSLLAGRFSERIDADRLRKWFAYLVFLVAGYILVDLIFLG